jgi:hypothetical protein
MRGYPCVGTLWSWGPKALNSLSLTLEKLMGSNWKTVEKYYERREIKGGVGALDRII